MRICVTIYYISYICKHNRANQTHVCVSYNMCVYIYIYIHMYVYMCVCVCTYVFAREYIYIYIYTYGQII